MTIAGFTQHLRAAKICASAAGGIAIAALCWTSATHEAHAADVKIVKRDFSIDAQDPGIKLFMREKMAEGNSTFTKDNVVLFLHGATFPSTPDFDLQYKDYSWADRLVKKGFVVYMVDYRNYGFSTRGKKMDAPAKANRPVTRSYLAIRDIDAAVDYILKTRHVPSVDLIGWSWGATLGGFYTSLHSEKVTRLVMYAPAYAFPLHTNLGPGSGLQDRRHPYEFNYRLGAYRLGTAAANDKRWEGEIPVTNKDEYRERGVADAFNEAALATDPTSDTRNPPSLRAPNGVLEDTFYQETGRRIWNASSIYSPVLVIAGEYDTWSYPEDRAVLMRDLTNAPYKEEVLIKDATHFVLFEKNREPFFEAVEKFLAR